MNTLPSSEKVSPSDQQLKVRRGRVESVDLYEIKENELDLLEKGSPSGLYLNFSIFLLSLAFGAITTLSTAKFGNPRVETLYIVLAVVGTLGGLFLLLLWWRTRESIRQVVKDIRGRIPPDVERTEVDGTIDVEPKG